MGEGRQNLLVDERLNSRSPSNSRYFRTWVEGWRIGPVQSEGGEEEAGGKKVYTRT